MRSLFILLLIALLAGVGVVAMIETEPGYVLIAYGNVTVETSLWVGIVLLIALAAAVYFGIGLLQRLWASPKSLSGWLGGRRLRKGARLTNRGLISFIEGNWSRARQQLLRGARHNDAPLLNYLIAARASYLLEEPDKMREYLGAAEASESDAGIAVELTQAEIQLGAGHYEQAVATLVRARRNAGRHPYVLSLLLKAYRELKDWDNLAALLPDCRKYKVQSAEQLAELEHEIAEQKMRAAARIVDESESLQNLHKQWQQLPSALKKDACLGAVYVGLLAETDDQGAAEKVCVKLLKQQWTPELVRLYGLIESTDTGAQLRQGQKWLAERGGDATLLLSLGRIASRDKQWEKAKEHFEASFKLQPTPEVCAELGRLLESLGDAKVSAAYYRQGMQLAHADLPELPKPVEVLPQTRRLSS